MKFKIDDNILGAFPQLKIGLIVCKGINNIGSCDEIINLIREREKEIRANFNKEDLSQNPKIETWRKAYSAFGAKPKKYKCSVENLYRMILDGKEIGHINKLVDIYNYISIKNIIPMGGDDLDKINGDIILKYAKGDESFIELGSEEVKNPKEGEIVYADDNDILCRRWNHRECDKSKMSENTINAALVIEGLSPFSKEEIDAIIKELSELIKKYCGGETESFFLDKDIREVEI